MRIVAGIDDAPIPIETVVQSQIGEAWFDLKPDAPPVAVRWRPEPGFPGSAWTITVPGGWPAGKAAEPTCVEPAREVRCPRHVDAVGERSSGRVRGTRRRGRPGQIREAGVHRGRVPHAPNDPLWVRPRGFVPSGSEIRFYEGANRTTCLFWWTTRSSMRNR